MLIKVNGWQQLQRIWTIDLKEKWCCIWDDLLRLFAIAGVVEH